MKVGRFSKILAITIVLGSVLGILVSACGGYPKLIDPEEKLGTDGSDLAVFHKFAEGDQGLSLRFPGYIIGIEKSYHSKLNTGGECSLFSCSDIEVSNLDEAAFLKETEGLDDGEAEARRNYKKIKGILKDPKRMYVSHIVRYQLEQDSGFPFIAEQRLFSVYDKGYELGSRNLYADGKAAVRALAKDIQNDVEQGRYSHILFYSMGWNTDQQEAIRNYNSLIGQLRNQAPGDFNPLFIGLTWPSEWSWPWALEEIGKPVSYIVKAPDADEVGMLWGSLILRELLLPAKRSKPEVPLVVLGHSFGARVMTRAVFGIPGQYPEEKEPGQADIDLVFAIQGAFSVNRFVHKAGVEGSPYKRFSERARKFVLTWSKHDSANPLAAFATGAQHAGGKPAYKTSRKYPEVFDRYKLHIASSIDPNTGEQLAYPDCNFDLVYQQTILNDNQPMGTPWDSLGETGDKIAMVDVSDLVRFAPYQKGGGSHSDIYTPGMAAFIWDALAMVQGESKPKVKPPMCWGRGNQGG